MSVRGRLSAVVIVLAMGFGHAGCSDDDASGAVCGNGIVEAGEDCDDGNNLNGDGCSGSCMDESTSECGNGTVETGEECDDGNTTNGDGCSATCQDESTPECGNGTVETGEDCDDGNTTNGDGCSATCQDESTPECGNGTVETGEDCDDGNTTDGDGCSATCQDESTPECGNGTVETGEDCDDGNSDNTDACPDGTGGTCLDATCGDGFVHTGTEGCDDGNLTDGDGCSATCELENCGNGTVETGEDCDDGNDDNTDACPDGTGGTCLDAVCGDGFIWDGHEECDDGNLTDGDGCSTTCISEICGDGTLQGGEACDDGNLTDGDGCESDCTVTICGDPADCGDVNSFICDVNTQTCQATQCTPAAGNCGTGCTGVTACCFEEETGTGLGACFELCDPYDFACPTGLDCTNVNSNQGAGFCQQPGPAAMGAVCTASSVGTGCVAGSTCLNDGANDACFEVCDFFGSTPSCTDAASSCHVGGYCDTAEAVNAANIGELCTGTPAAWDPCHAKGDGFAGICVNPGSGLECVELCQIWSLSGTITTCTTGTCHDDLASTYFGGDIGLCH